MSSSWIIVIVMGVAMQFGGLWCYFASDRYRKSLGVSPRGTRLNLVLPLSEPTETLPAYSASTLPVVFAESGQPCQPDSCSAMTAIAIPSRAAADAVIINVSSSSSLPSSLFPASPDETQEEQGCTVVANVETETRWTCAGSQPAE